MVIGLSSLIRSIAAGQCNYINSSLIGSAIFIKAISNLVTFHKRGDCGELIGLCQLKNGLELYQKFRACCRVPRDVFTYQSSTVITSKQAKQLELTQCALCSRECRLSPAAG